MVINGTITIDLVADSGAVDHVGIEYTPTETSRTCPNPYGNGQPTQLRGDGPGSGSASNIQFSDRQDVPNPTTTMLFAAQSFTGALANGAISGAVTVSHGGSNLPFANGDVISYGYNATTAVTLQKRLHRLGGNRVCAPQRLR